jgi:hypothetical protein
MVVTIGIPKSQQDRAIQAINSFFLGGLILDLMAAVLAFLTARWLQRLTPDEKQFLERKFAAVEHGRDSVPSDKSENPCLQQDSLPQPPADGDTESTTLVDKILCAWFAMSLFVPMPLLTMGIFCLIIGSYIFAWTQQAVIVASWMTLAGAGTLPFLVGVFAIGTKHDGKAVENRRKILIRNLSKMQGAW